MMPAARNRSTMLLNRREFLMLIGSAGLATALPYRLDPDELTSPIADLLPCYLDSTRNNIVVRRGGRAILSSHIYPKGTFVRDAFYGPLALNDIGLSRDCYRWFERTQLSNGQIMTAVGFTPDDQADLTPMDDDSSMLFIIWSAWLQRQGVEVKQQVVERAFAHVQSHVSDRGDFVSPSGPFRYWADTVNPERPERITHNQGLYALALRSMRSLGWGGVTDRQVAAAKARYAGCYQPALKSLTLGRDTWWALKQDVSTVFPEFLFRWLFRDSALPNSIITDTVARLVRTAAVYKDGKIAGIKVICRQRRIVSAGRAVQRAGAEQPWRLSKRRLLADVHAQRTGAGPSDRAVALVQVDDRVAGHRRVGRRLRVQRAYRPAAGRRRHLGSEAQRLHVERPDRSGLEVGGRRVTSIR